MIKMSPFNDIYGVGVSGKLVEVRISPIKCGDKVVPNMTRYCFHSSMRCPLRAAGHEPEPEPEPAAEAEAEALPFSLLCGSTSVHSYVFIGDLVIGH